MNVIVLCCRHTHVHAIYSILVALLSGMKCLYCRKSVQNQFHCKKEIKNTDAFRQLHQIKIHIPRETIFGTDQ